MKPHIHVACAIIEQNGLTLAAQRNETMSLPLKWEFPGGKMEPGETVEQCLVRELHEELAIAITIIHPLAAATHSYENVTVTLHPFVCAVADGELTLREHRAIAWLKAEQLPDLDWAAADLPIIADYLSFRNHDDKRSCQP